MVRKFLQKLLPCSRLKTANCARKGPLQVGRSVFYPHLHTKGEKWSTQCWPRSLYSQAQQSPCAVTQKGDTHSNPPIPPFLVAHNLSSNQIAPTDNMRPKCLTFEVMKFSNAIDIVFTTNWQHQTNSSSVEESFTFHEVSTFSKNVSRIRNTESFKVCP